MKRKPTHGGARENAGRPVSTGSGLTPPIHYRVSAGQLADLKAEARTLPRVGRTFMTASAVAKLRAFPGPPPCSGEDCVCRAFPGTTRKGSE